MRHAACVLAALLATSMSAEAQVPEHVQILKSAFDAMVEGYDPARVVLVPSDDRELSSAAAAAIGRPLREHAETLVCGASTAERPVPACRIVGGDRIIRLGVPVVQDSVAELTVGDMDIFGDSAHAIVWRLTLTKRGDKWVVATKEKVFET